MTTPTVASADVIRQLRDKGWPVRSIAANVGVTRQMVYRYASGKVEPASDVLRLLVAMLDRPAPAAASTEILLKVMRRLENGGIVEADVDALCRQSGYRKSWVKSNIRKLLSEGLIRRLESPPLQLPLWEIVDKEGKHD